MDIFRGRRILLGITGSIAAYKGVEIASKLTQEGALVDVVLTGSATKFVAPLSFQSVTGRKAYTDDDLWGSEGHVTHISLGRAAELVIIAPASANTIGRVANGLADNLLCVTLLAADCSMLFAPAMDAGMYSRPATTANVELLKARGVEFIGPAAGHLASGLVGVGRMEEPARIISAARMLLGKKGKLAGKRLIITAGGTREAIDPVRTITNHSSGKQGYAVAQAAVDQGAEVTLVTTTDLPVPVGCTAIRVDSAADMLKAVMAGIKSSNGLIMSAAVADFKPVHTAEEKIKKDTGFSQINLEPTVDILKEVSMIRDSLAKLDFVIGFAAESEDLLENARVKLNRKKLDMIVANDISAQDAGFGVDTNRVILIQKDGKAESLPLMTKSEVAAMIIDKAIEITAAGRKD